MEASSDSLVISTPSTVMEPSCGRINPITLFRKVLLPQPEPPMITRVSPVSTIKSTPRRIWCLPKLFLTPWASIMVRLGNSQSHQDGGYEIVRDQHADHAVNHRLCGGFAHALRPSPRRDPLIAGNKGNDKSKNKSLKKTVEKMLYFNIIYDVMPVDGGRDPEFGIGHHPASQHAGKIRNN